ncbi:AlpA family phage regulatory protein [Vibrio sp. RE86]|uniref:helix-turn-helix transcriptional regulator n=1 Tax=Vibrio sp. RE86 TaxID=2607605 RepID=UPI0014936428|nr:AlpA family phage regulatory protein [Vibrio sp. RE86]NOH79514.1 AlpA family phage regulatory protein [Vibrio sp. RE86]
MNHSTPARIIRKSEVLERLQISKSTLYRQITMGTFVPPISLGARAVGFIEHEVQAIIDARVQAKPIKEVVATLIARREERASLKQ